ncbi:MAG: alcohol dehydrogenase catalytic domain-containing protein [Chloroflexi bacterium]|nr:alcohol dehydrogenase catalytic domain-containing protein [Chloroflexota bacterium]
MKAAYVTAPMQIELRETPIPQIPEDGILIAVKACGICGSDLRRWREGPGTEHDPLIAGHEIAGVVTKVGSQAKGYIVGERLAVAPDVHCGKCYYCEHGLYNLCDHLHLIGITPGYNGGFAEHLVLTAEMLDGGIVHRVPDTLSFAEAALAEPLSSVLAAHAEAGTTLGDTVVVMGAGPIGCLHLAAARARGARVILSEPSEVRRRIATRFEPELIVDPMSQNLVDEVLRMTDGLGADTAICANPVAATHAQAVELVRKRGKVVLFGGLPKSSPMTTLDGNRLHYNEIQVIGTFSYHPTYHALALEAIERGLINSGQVITHTFSLDEIERAFQTAASGEALKVMVQLP